MTSKGGFRGSPILSILSDHPAEEDQLNFAPYARTLADIIADPATSTPLTIGILGSFGRGKTSLMRMMQHRLENTADSTFPVQTVWLNTWHYKQQHVLARALISRVLEGVRRFPTLDDNARATLRHLAARIHNVTDPNSGQITTSANSQITIHFETLTGLESITVAMPLGLELLRRQASRAQNAAATDHLEELIVDIEECEAIIYRDQLTAGDDFRRQFEMISRYFIMDHGRLAIFLDDLDRCLPEQAVEILETTKLFLEMPGCVFILGAAQEVIEEGIRRQYAEHELDSTQYLESMIQIPFHLPPLAPETTESYVRNISGASLPDPRCETVFAVGLEPNPRRTKRTLNIFMLLWRLAQNRADLRQIIKPVRLAKIVVIQQYHPRLFGLLTEGPHHLIDLEHRFREQENWAMDTSDEGSDSLSAGPLIEFLGRSKLRVLLTCTAAEEPDSNFINMSPAGVREYLFLTKSTVAETEVYIAETMVPFEPQMVTVPAGPFLMGTSRNRESELEELGLKQEHIEYEMPLHEILLESYAIGRYPVTNTEFARFIDDLGYENKDYWTDIGWKEKEREGWKQPRHWDDKAWNDPAQPAVGISWYEAVAYCRWLTTKTGKPYRLPTEAEWEKAARGTGNRQYPWGDEWDAQRCNNEESGPGHTTPVGQYSPAGDSPHGASDIVGQVWEWCSSKRVASATEFNFNYPYRSDDGREEMAEEDIRIQRGGSWADDNPALVCRCAHRHGAISSDRNNRTGFRCVRTIPGEALFPGEIEQAQKTELERRIQESFTLFREYEAIVQTSDTPEGKTHALQLVREQWKVIMDYTREYKSLAGEDFAAEVSEIIACLPDDIDQIQKAYPSIHILPEQLDKTEAATDFETFLHRELAESEVNLQLIRERMTQYVLQVEIPLQLVKEERRLQTRISRLKEDLRFST